MKCKRCGEELSEYCTECLSKVLAEAIRKIKVKRERAGKEYPIEEEK